jgi:SNF2 family DNA or RNA helicase
VESIEHGRKESVAVAINGVKPGSKRQLLKEVLGDIDPHEPVVICCRFHTDLDQAAAVAASLGRPCAEISGRVSDLAKHGRNSAKWEPRRAAKPNDFAEVLIVQIRSGGVGLDFTASHHCILFSIGYSLTDYRQFLARQRRPGQAHKCHYAHLIAKDTVNEHVYKALGKKEKLVDSVSAMVKAGGW